ncbi:hypothetical protein K474DRAFT_282367 [Panus rudis PR-1116 ss-1]|nr:hypothetical protein K474DRAFT_282367 [Panus rudis PR-1116 ss-1]
MSDQLTPNEEELLQSALNNAFTESSLPPLPKVDPTPPQLTSSVSSEPAPVDPTPVIAPSSSGPDPAEEEWKAEYEHHLAEWKARNAEQRAKAEAERKKWEEIREKEAKEKQEKKARGEPVDEDEGDENLGASITGSVGGSGWVGVGTNDSQTSKTASVVDTPSPVDARDLVTGEGQKHESKEELESILPGPSSSPPEGLKHDRYASGTESSKHENWEEVSSGTSSYPSISYPSDPHSPSSTNHPGLHPVHADPRHPSHHHHHHHEHHAQPAGEDATRTSPTFAIFDSRLSTKTRVLALVSSLAINLLLPFVNGVMLGFGEIFARNVVVGWFGWKTPARPGSTAADVGIGKGRSRKQ